MSDETIATSAQRLAAGTQVAEPEPSVAEALHALLDHMTYQASQNAPITPYMLQELRSVLDKL